VEKVVGSKLEQRILGLYRNVNVSYSILQISKKLHTSYPHVYNKVQQLVKQGILTQISVGPSNLCRLNLDNDMTLAMLTVNSISMRDEWINSTKKHQLLTLLRELQSRHPGLIALSSKNKLFAVVDCEEKLASLRKELSPLTLEYLTYSQLRLMPDEFMEQAIILIGFEAFFRLLKTKERRLLITK
jgi:DNA-binding Lrp family transcriptional regulator